MKLTSDRTSGMLKMLIVMGLVLSLMGYYSAGAEPPKAETSKKSSRLAKITPAQKIALNKAIAALVKEYQAAAKAPNAKVREKSNYFQENPSSDITPDVVLNTITLPARGTPGLEAYIRWQLLSALPEKVEPGMERYILIAYQEAPRPFPQLGMNEMQKRQLEMKIRQISKGAEDTFMQQVVEEVSKINESNSAILSYRRSLFERLPINYETIEAGLRDVYERAQAGTEVEDMLATITKAAETWTTDAKPEDTKRMSVLINRLTQEKMPTFFDRAVWNDQLRQFNWRSTSIDLSRSKAMDKLAETFGSHVKDNGQ